MPNPVVLISASLAVINFYADNSNILPDSTAYYYAAINNKLDVLEWLYSKGIEYPEQIINDQGFLMISLELLFVKWTWIASL